MAALLESLRTAGFRLEAVDEGTTLRVSPATRLTPQQRAALRREAQEAATRRRAPHDPRPHLGAAHRDAVWWSVLLALAAEVHGEDAPGGVYGTLHGVRCLGAALARAPTGALRIVAGAVPAPEWRAARSAWLAPHRAAVLELLRAVATAWEAHAADLAAVAATIRDVRSVWPDARPLSPTEVAALDALPIVGRRTAAPEDSPALIGGRNGQLGAATAQLHGGQP